MYLKFISNCESSPSKRLGQRSSTPIYPETTFLYQHTFAKYLKNEPSIEQSIEKSTIY